MEKNKLIESITEKRFWLSIIIICVSLYLLYHPLKQISEEHWETVFTAIIGLVGTWVGTVLAFYFSKENFEAASNTTQKLVDSITTTKEKLTSILVKDAMIPINKMKFLLLDQGKTLNNYLLKDLLENYLKDVNRLPILNSDKTLYGIAHKSLIVEYIVEKAFENPELTSSLTLVHRTA